MIEIISLKDNVNGCYINCFRTDNEINPYRIYIKKSDNTRRRLIAEYADFISVLCFLKDFYCDEAEKMDIRNIVQRSIDNGSLILHS